MSMLGDRVPVSLKIFLTALAIADDLGAILVVAFFYGGAINLTLLLIAFGILFLVFLLNKAGVKSMIYYLIPAIAIWILFYYAGIHATMSGVVMAMMIPMKARYSRSYFNKKTAHYQDMIEKLHDDEESPNHDQQVCLNSIGNVARGSVGMSYRLEHALTPWVNFVIMPIFAIANAGVVIPDLSYLNFFQYSQIVEHVVIREQILHTTSIKVNCCYTNAVIKCVISNRNNAVGNCYAHKACATRERRRANTCYTFGNHKLRYKFAIKI
jgi:NhaA family Na+:H+ antiporter